jgi:hypothetical protein
LSIGPRASWRMTRHNGRFSKHDQRHLYRAATAFE